MSTLRTATLSDVAGTNSPDVTRGEFCRARIYFTGTGTVAVRDSFNTASLTDNGTGDYTQTFSNAFPNGDYSHTSNCDNFAAGIFMFQRGFSAFPSTTALRYGSLSSAIAAADAERISIIVVGDKS